MLLFKASNINSGKRALPAIVPFGGNIDLKVCQERVHY